MKIKMTLINDLLNNIRGMYEMEHGLVQHIVKGLQKMNLTSVQNLDFLISLNKENLRSDKDKKIADLKKENADLQKRLDDLTDKYPQLHSSEETKKYYISYYMKNEHGSTSIQFKTWDEGIAFCSALDSNSDLESRSFLKRIK